MAALLPTVSGIAWVPRIVGRGRFGAMALLLAGCGAARTVPTTGANAAAPRAEVVLATAPAPLRRLTNEEYDNSVRDLLGDRTRPADAFPPDEVVAGFENNTVSPVTEVLVERYMAAAEALAAHAVARLDALAPCAKETPRESCGRALVDGLGRRAFRRPLDDAEREALLAIYFAKERTSGHARAAQLVIEAIFQSAPFLYRVEPASEGGGARALTGYELATRLSYFVWASTPDVELLDDAAAGRLTTSDDVARAARRLLRDPRAADGVKSFHRQWLGLRELATESKDLAVYPTFSPELKAAMVEETLRFSADVVLAGGDAVAALLTSKTSFVDASLARLYGVAPPPGGGFARVDLPPLQRSGLLTHASVMTVLAKDEQTAPITRGKLVRERLLCQPIPPPPSKAILTLPRLEPGMTKKERFEKHRTDPSCAGCHRRMDPIGFGFEHYDALGAWRTVDRGFPVDAGGALAGTDVDGPFDGAVALGARLASSTQVRRCVATQWFRAALGRVEREEDARSIEGAYEVFARSGFDVRELIVAIAASDSFRHVGFEGGTSQ